MAANPKLLKIQNVERNEHGINALHEVKEQIFELMETENDVNQLRHYDQQLEGIEFKLQELWHFPKDKKFHKFWKRPKCTCPKMDNEDRYPFGYYVISADCPLHGDYDA
jgi:hypothetical protein